MYKDLKIWQKAMDLTMEIYSIADKLPKSEEYNLKSQLKRAIVSVPLNIAEGKTRFSSKEFSHFLNIASDSLTEVEVILELSLRLGYIEQNISINDKIINLNKMINALRTKLLKGDNYE